MEEEKLKKLVFNEMIASNNPTIKSVGDKFVMDEMPYNAILSKDISSMAPLKYVAEGKYITFTPTRLFFNNSQNNQTIIASAVSKIVGVEITNAQEVNGNYGIGSKGVVYKNTFGKGISMGVITDKTRFSKVIKIDSLFDLGLIPAKAEFVDIEFEIDTDFDIDKWDKQTDFEITSQIKIGSNIYLSKAKIWDSTPEITEAEKLTMIDNNDYNFKKGEQITQCFLVNRNGKLFLIKRLLVDWLKNAIFPIYTDVDITYGTGVCPETEIVYDYSATTAKLDTNKFILAFYTPTTYGDYTGDRGYVIVGTVSGTAVTFGSPYEFDNNLDSSDIGLCALDTDKFVVCFSNGDDADDGYVRVGTVSGTVVSFGAAASEWSTDDCSYICAIQLGTDKFAIIWNPTANGVKTIVGTVSGSTPSFGSAITVDAGGRYSMGMVEIDTDKYVVMYRDYADASQARARVITVSGTAATAQAEYTMGAADDTLYGVGLRQLETDKFIWVGDFNDKSRTPDRGLYGCIGTVSGNTISFGDTTIINNAADVGYILQSIAVISTSLVSILYRDENNSDYTTSNLLTISGSTITPGDNEVVDSVAGYGHPKDSGPGELIDTNKVLHIYNQYLAAQYDTYAIAGTYGAAASGPANLKTWNGLAKASIKTINGLAIASVKTINSLA